MPYAGHCMDCTLRTVAPTLTVTQGCHLSTIINLPLCTWYRRTSIPGFNGVPVPSGFRANSACHLTNYRGVRCSGNTAPYYHRTYLCQLHKYGVIGRLFNALLPLRPKVNASGFPPLRAGKGFNGRFIPELHANFITVCFLRSAVCGLRTPI